jgi:microsomal epoxide hydrolase
MGAVSLQAAARNSELVQVANGVSLRVIVGGKDNSNKTLIFIPGWSASADVWQKQLDDFARKYRVLSFDPRSQGDSTKTKTGNTPEVRAQDLHVLLRRRTVQRPVLIGWSQGVQDVAAYVERYGTSDIAGIVLVDAAVSDGADGILARSQEAAEQFHMFSIYEAHQREYLHGMWQAITSQPQAPELIGRLVATGTKTPSSVGVAMLVADLFTVNRTPALAKIKCPTLIIASAKSAELERQQAMTSQIANARFEKIDQAAHAVFLDQPDRFDELLSKFLDSLPPT